MSTNFEEIRNTTRVTAICDLRIFIINLDLENKHEKDQTKDLEKKLTFKSPALTDCRKVIMSLLAIAKIVTFKIIDEQV